MHETAQFDQSAEQYAEHLETIRGYVRTVVTQAQLAPYMPSLPGFVVDVGGGTGVDSIFAAQQGHEVLMLDPSDRMLSLARTALNLVEGSLPGTITVAKGDILAARAEFGVTYADAVLDHGVLMYQTSPQEHINELAAIAGQGGIVSLLTKGFDALAAKLTRDNEIGALEALRQTKQWRQNNLGHAVWAHKPEEVVAMLQSAGLNVLAWFGVRLETDSDFRKKHELPTEELNYLVERELAAGADESRKASGHMLHFIAQKS